jgi:CubicO group peptidase (beta-lactamase class C family)
LIVEDVSGASYEQFLDANIWKPLGMRDTRITLTTPLRQRLATPYEYVNGVHAVQPFEWYHTIPASSISSTATDMARFMLAHLAPRPALMRTQSRRVMHSTHARGHPDVPGVAYGFFEGDYAGQRVLEHGGAMAGTSTNMVLLPAHAAGFFVASQLEGNPLGGILKEAILDHFFATDNARRRPSAISGTEPPLASFAGRYRWNVYCRSCGGAAPAQGPSVTVTDDAVMFAGRRWIRIAPLLFRRDDGARVIGFRQDQTGRITHLFIDGALTFERID